MGWGSNRRDGCRAPCAFGACSSKYGSHRRTETGQRGDVTGQTLELPNGVVGAHEGRSQPRTGSVIKIVSPGSSLAEALSQHQCAQKRCGAFQPLHLHRWMNEFFLPSPFCGIHRQFQRTFEIVIGCPQ